MPQLFQVDFNVFSFSVSLELTAGCDNISLELPSHIICFKKNLNGQNIL